MKNKLRRFEMSVKFNKLKKNNEILVYTENQKDEIPFSGTFMFQTKKYIYFDPKINLVLLLCIKNLPKIEKKLIRKIIIFDIVKKTKEEI
jgi:hypothetical protein